MSLQEMTDTAIEDGFDEFFWEDLLAFMEERRVIPIVGADMVCVEEGGEKKALYPWLARQLAARLNLREGDLPENPTLNAVICTHLSGRGRREDVYPRLRAILREAPFSPSEPLVQLASITDFNLYVTTTFDSMLEQAVNQARFGGEPRCEVLAYAPNKVVDLPCEKEHLSRPTIYHLFGKLSAAPSYAISDEDILEFVYTLQSENFCPETLFSELENNNLLLLGSGFSDWLERFFLRMAKRRRLSDPRDVLEVVADSQTPHDPNLVLFLRHVSSRTKVFRGGDATTFVAELWRRWSEKHPEKAKPAAASGTAAPARFLPPEREMPEGAVFISYAREDLAAVQQLKSGLDAAGVTSWFDMDRLEAGDDYDHKIRQNISRCAYFLPIISANTDRRVEGYFRREWNYAIDRMRNMADGAIFILPIAIDTTAESTALVPDRFRSAHWTRLPGGAVTPEFAKRLHDLSRR